MAAKKNDYSRFYALLKKHPEADKEELVLDFTNGRTTHVSQMKRDEFTALCDMLQYGSEQEQQARNIALKKARSAALLRIGRLGIQTIDNWDGINAFVQNPKIAGKKFYDLTVDELKSLVNKLEAIIRKGGLKVQEQPAAEPSAESAPKPIDNIGWMLMSKRSITNPKCLS